MIHCEPANGVLQLRRKIRPAAISEPQYSFRLWKGTFSSTVEEWYSTEAWNSRTPSERIEKDGEGGKLHAALTPKLGSSSRNSRPTGQI
ncbi:hypothetical protein QLX08_007976 [Tetragonisca angustula]|uniref:Uncharacterized protein n=1 Tax=Tetragonisca angustula TaxID=166442 RepID=A0AAW0ZMM6_9HYME